MMDKPTILDLFCGAGGAARGYQQAGFYVVGVDINPQPHYCGDEFIQADALEYLDTVDLGQFSAIHASPLCEGFTKMLNWDERHKEKYQNFIPPVRERLQKCGLPYVIENVEGAPVENPIMLCGTMFPGLRVIRHRLFESNILLFQPYHDSKYCRSIKVAKASRIPRGDEWWCPVGCFGQKDGAQKAMGIDWMKTTGSRDTEIAKAIPPAYTAWIGQFLMQVIIRNECEVAV